MVLHSVGFDVFFVGLLANHGTGNQSGIKNKGIFHEHRKGCAAFGYGLATQF